MENIPSDDDPFGPLMESLKSPDNKSLKNDIEEKPALKELPIDSELQISNAPDLNLNKVNTKKSEHPPMVTVTKDIKNSENPKQAFESFYEDCGGNLLRNIDEHSSKPSRYPYLLSLKTKNSLNTFRLSQKEFNSLAKVEKIRRKILERIFYKNKGNNRDLNTPYQTNKSQSKDTQSSLLSKKDVAKKVTNLISTNLLDPTDSYKLLQTVSAMWRDRVSLEEVIGLVLYLEEKVKLLSLKMEKTESHPLSNMNSSEFGDFKEKDKLEEEKKSEKRKDERKLEREISHLENLKKISESPSKIKESDSDEWVLVEEGKGKSRSEKEESSSDSERETSSSEAEEVSISENDKNGEFVENEEQFYGEILKKNEDGTESVQNTENITEKGIERECAGNGKLNFEKNEEEERVKCSRCTFVYSKKDGFCGICGAKRDYVPFETWSCDFCGYKDNTQSDTVCDVCGGG